ncbi:MAG: hypothetical protein FJ090_12890 [Deltaproteobacteria bacterium]|nr:hypothetical protein [Deltaproteobacteria bacterium]
MKLLLPIATVIVAGGFCCCGDIVSQLQGLAGSGGDDFDININVDGDGDPEMAAGSVLAGTCGRFKEMSLHAPPGMSVMVCSEGGGNDSIVLSGSGDPSDACKSVKSWAEGAGFTTEFDVNSSGTYAVTLKKGSDRLSVGCTAMAGQTTVSITLTPA